MNRLLVYLTTTFCITWTCWWALVLLTHTGMMAYGFGHPLFMVIYMIGGLGPTFAAYAAVCATPAQSPLKEFNARLFRWRVAWWWYLLVLALPAALALASLALASLVDPHPQLSTGMPAHSWYMFFLLFPVMILGGGLEELGWRGVAQPEMERRVARPAAAVLVGLIWSVWHLPLFFLPGVSQYGTNFFMFLIGVVGNALILAWIYGRTSSILLCIFFHASFNATAALGLGIPGGKGWLSALNVCLGMLAGALLLAFASAKSDNAARINL
ncbi:MAG TPA: CPBP family intramembrane glutamic endopeptidase [Terracidiphilus sp.]